MGTSGLVSGGGPVWVGALSQLEEGWLRNSNLSVLLSLLLGVLPLPSKSCCGCRAQYIIAGGGWGCVDAGHGLFEMSR